MRLIATDGELTTPEVDLMTFRKPINQQVWNEKHQEQIIPASDPNGGFVTSLGAHLLGLLRLFVC